MKNVEDVYKLSPLQRELLARAPSSLEPRVEHLCWSFRGELDEGALEGALKELVRRHTALRTAFFTQGLAEPMQVVRAQVDPTLERQDLTTLPEAEQTARIEQHLATQRERGLNLIAAPLVGLTLFRTSAAMGTLVFGYSPLVLDRTSARICLKELFQLYKATREKSEAGLEPGQPFRKYVAWLEQQDPREAEVRFREALHGLQPSRLPERTGTDETPGTSAWLTQQLILSTAESETVQTFVRKNKVSLGTLAQAAWAVLLRRQTGASDTSFGVYVTGRPAETPWSDVLVGGLANTLPRRISVPSEGNLLRWLRGLHADLSAWQSSDGSAPNQVRQWLGVPEGTPLFQSVVSTEEVAEDDVLVPLARGLGFQLPAVPLSAPTHPLCVSVVSASRVSLRFTYDTRRFESLAIIHLTAQLHALLVGMTSQPEQDLTALLQATVEPLRATASSSRELGPRELQTLLAQHPAVRQVRVTEGPRGLVSHVVPAPRPGAGKKLDFSLFFFADDGGGEERYRLYLEAGKFADRHGFSAVWSPERHFHEHGGLYPNPAVLNAALATVTKNVGLRAGSVVLPLQSPFRVAEEWSIVDNLSNGRAGISIASGWVPNDFAFAPENYANKREVMFRNLDLVQRLWRGESIPAKDGVGNDITLRVFPRPVQEVLPIWVTCAGGVDLFEKTGRDGYHMLTSLLGQSLEDALQKTGIYQTHLRNAGHDPSKRVATLMMHTFLGKDTQEVLHKVREPLTQYLASHVHLMQTMAKSLNLQVDINEPKWVRYVASFAFERYYRTGALIGTPTSCLPMVDRLIEGGVNEVACFIDFGVETDDVLESLVHLAELKRLVDDESLRTRQVLNEYLDERLPGARPAVTFDVVEALPATP